MNEDFRKSPIWQELFLTKKGGGGGSSVTVEQLNVSQNGTYTAQSGKAYSPVVVACPEPKTEDTLSVSQNGTYNPESGHTYGQVVVACPEPKTEDTLSVSQNGTYTPTSGHVYSEVNVDVPPVAVQDVPRKDVNFFSYDGHRIASYTIAEIAAMTELPAVPVVAGLANGTWNWTLAELKAHAGKANVGAYYDNAGTASVLKVECKFATTVSVEIRTVTDSITIDWGDGSTPLVVTSSGKYNHKYQPGTYSINIDGGQNNVPIGDLTPGSVFKSCRLAAGDTVDTASQGNYYGFEELIGGGASIRMMPHRLKFFVFHHDCTGITKWSPSAVHVCIGPSVTSIPTAYTYYQNISALKEIYTPAVSGCPVVYYNNKAFGIQGLEDIYIPTSSYGDNAFRQCGALGDIVIPEGVTSIGANAFVSTDMINSVDLPSTLTTLNGFTNSTSTNCLRTVIFRGTTPPTVSASTVFNGLASRPDAKILVPQAALADYQATTNLTQFASIMEGY